MFLTVSDVAQRLNVSRSSVYQLIEAGRLPHHRIGLARGAIRVSEDDFTEYLASCRAEAKSGEKPAKTSRPKLKHIRL